MSPSITLLALCFPLVYAFLSRVYTLALRYQLKHSNGCKPAPSTGQKADIFGLGYLIRWLRDVKTNAVNVSLQKSFEELGHTFEVVQAGKTRLFSIDPRNISVVWNRGAREWGLGPVRAFALEPFVGRGIMSSDGEFWEHSRSLVRPIFARDQIEDTHLALLEGHLQKLFAKIPRDGSTVDMQPLFGLLGLDTSTEFLFGESIGSLSPDGVSLDAKAFLASYNYGQRGVGMRIQLPPYNIFTRDPKFWQSCKVAHEFVEAYVDKAIRHETARKEKKKEKNQEDDSGKPYILAYELAEKTTDRTDIRNQLLNVFLPAHDAVAVVLTNAIFVLARHPDAWARLRQELAEHNLLGSSASSRSLKLEKLKQLTYLQYVMNEVFRLHPTIGVMSRSALQDTVLPAGGGPDGTSPLFVPKGTLFSMHLYALHRRRDIFGEDAASFRPERWETLHPGHYEFLPFGRGPRTCPAEKFAVAQVTYTLVRFLQKFSKLENRDPVHEFVELYKISTESKNGAKVAFVAA